jgi:phosphoribosylformimino-5-aminoimidazole carboxamide ribotide isomerase
VIIYPAVDIRGGRVVRLLQGRADQETVYHDSPEFCARQWLEAGAEWVHVVDLDGAFNGQPANLHLAEAIVSTGLKVQWGGGMRSLANVEAALSLGISRVVIGTKAVTDEAFLQELVQKFGDRIAVGIDAKDGRVATDGWVDVSEMTAFDLAEKVAAMGVKTLIYTDISRDGMLVGPNFEAQQQMLACTGMDLIASGGVASDADIVTFRKMHQEYSRLNGVIVGKALYDGRVHLKQLLEK